MNELELKSFIEKYSIDKVVINCLESYLIEYQKEHFEEFDMIFPYYSFSKISTWIHSISYRAYNWPELDYINIVVELIVSYEENDIGCYQLFYDLEGEIVDDVLKL